MAFGTVLYSSYVVITCWLLSVDVFIDVLFFSYDGFLLFPEFPLTFFYCTLQ
jgi:hypothetical protein